MASILGLQVFVSIALILGDGLYNFLRILYFTATNIHARAKKSNLKTGNFTTEVSGPRLLHFLPHLLMSCGKSGQWYLSKVLQFVFPVRCRHGVEFY